jgi:hypothetical protein
MCGNIVFTLKEKYLLWYLREKMLRKFLSNSNGETDKEIAQNFLG